MRRTSFNRGVALATALCATAAVQTATIRTAAAQQDGPPPTWSFMLGAGALYHPDYEGSNDYEVAPVPLVEVSWRDRVTLTTRGGIGLFATPLKTDSFRLDLGVRYDFGRDESDNDALKGLGDLEGGAVAVVRLGYEVGPVGFGLEFAQDMGGDREGLLITAETEYSVGMFGGKGRFSLTPHVSWADENYMENSFGITATQAARSLRRYARYEAGSGFKDIGMTVGLGYRITERIQAMGRLDYSRLLGDAADSPLVKQEGSENQVSALLGLSYRW